MAWGFFFIGVASGIAFLPLAYLTGSEAQELVQKIFVISSFITLSLGFNLVIFAYKKLVETNTPVRHYLYMILNSIITPLILFYNVNLEWRDNSWILNYSNLWSQIVVISTLVFFLIEIFWATHKITENCVQDKVKIMHLINEGSILLIIPILLLRNTLNLSMNSVFIASSAYFLTLTILLFLYPELFLTSQIRPYFLMISNPDYAMPIKTYHFVNSEYEALDDVLLSGGLSAVQSILTEIGETDQIVKEMSFEKVTLMFVTTKNVGLTLASEQSSQSLRSLLDALGDSWNVPIGYQLNDEIESKIDKLVTNIFIHQLARLSLFTKTHNIAVKSTHHK